MRGRGDGEGEGERERERGERGGRKDIGEYLNTLDGMYNSSRKRRSE